MKKTTLVLVMGIICVLGAYYFYQELEDQVLMGPEAPASQEWTDVEETSEEKGAVFGARTSLNIEMPFYSQAPFGNWDYPWQEACEEASVLLVTNLYKSMNLSREAFNEELLKLVEWEIEYFGAYEHTTAAQTAEMLELRYGLHSKIHENPGFEDIRAILDKGHLLVAPFAGKVLGNPNFTNGGPVYHMLVIKGYDAEKNQIVTHDVGTRNGEDYVYSWDVINRALHDWHDEDILQGTPTLIEVLPPGL